MEKQPNPPLTMGIFGYVAQVGGHYISFWSNIDYLYQLKKICYGLTNFEHMKKRIFLIFEKDPTEKQ